MAFLPRRRRLAINDRCAINKFTNKEKHSHVRTLLI
jgi:hypothetical protein